MGLDGGGDWCCFGRRGADGRRMRRQDEIEWVLVLFVF